MSGTGMQAASDEEIFAKAAQEDRIVISADTDFGTLSVTAEGNKLSIILFRQRLERRPQKQLALLIENLESIQEALQKGSIVIFEQNRIRLRQKES